MLRLVRYYDTTQGAEDNPQQQGRAWALLGDTERLAWQVYAATCGDVYLVNPMSEAKHLVLRILPGAITDSMAEHDVPAPLRADVRERVKLLHEVSQGREPDLVVSMCRQWALTGEELCAGWDRPRGRGRSLVCKCARYWRDFLPE